MELVIVRKIQQSNSGQGLPFLSPSPLLTCCYFLRDAQLFALDIKTQEQNQVDVRVKDFLLCGSCEDERTCIVYMTSEDVLKMAVLEGTRLVSSHPLRVFNFQGGGMQLVCSIPQGFVFLYNESLVAISLAEPWDSSELLPLWQTQLESCPLRFQCNATHLFVLTSTHKIVSYELSTGSCGITWHLEGKDPHSVLCFAPLLLKHHYYMVLLFCSELVVLNTPSRSERRVTLFRKPHHNENWQHLMDVPPGSHLLVHRDSHLLFFWGPEAGLTHLAVLEASQKNIACTHRFDMGTPFMVLYDGRQRPCWNLPVLLQFEDRLVAPCLGTTQQMLMQEVMDRHGTSVAGFVSQLNSWAGNVAVDVLQQGIRHRQLDRIAFFLQTKEEVLETVVGRHMVGWNQALQDLIKTVRENSSQLSSRHFAQQLLQLLLRFVIRLLVMMESDDQDDERAALGNKLVAIRENLPKLSTSSICPGTLVVPEDPGCHGQQHLAFEEGCVPWVQYWMCNTKKTSLAELRMMGLCVTLEKLYTEENVMSQLSNMGLSPKEEMNRLRLSCRNGRLRALLCKALGENQIPNNVYERLARIEEAFPCHKVKIQCASRDGAIDAALAGYSRLAPIWLQHWSIETDDRIYADAYHRMSQGKSHLVNKTYWLYMLESGHVLSSLPQYVDRESLVNLGTQSSSMWHIYNIFLCTLVREGTFSEETLENLDDVLSLLGEANHPLDALLSSIVSVSPEDLVHRLLHYCLQHDLTVFLYFLTCEMKCNIKPQCHLCNTPLVSALVAHLNWIKKPDDEGRALSACWALVRALHGRPKDFSDLDLAALLRDPKVLQSFYVVTAQNVSLYSLLGRPWNTSRFFIWQNIHLSDQDAGMLPYFSHSALMDSCGLKEELSPTYYTLRGRPCFAYLKHITQHIVGQHTISNKRLRSTVNMASRTGRLHFEDPMVVASCVTFLELLGTDSKMLRLDVLCMRLLCENCDISQQKSTVELLEDAQHSKMKAEQMLRLLEAAILKKLQGPTQHGVELFLGVLLREFAMCHGLEPPLTVLHRSAQNDDWLGFLLWAQLFQFPKAQVLTAVMEFEDSCLREHLSKALLEVSSLQNTDGSTNVPPRNLRACLYSRIGLQTVERSSPGSPESLSEADTASIYSSDSMDVTLVEDAVTTWPRELVSLMLDSSSQWSWEHLLQAAVHIWCPIPCVVAASCADAPLVSGFVLWLATSGPRRSMELLSFKEHTLHDLMEMMQVAVLEGRLYNLLLGLHIFQPDSPLVALVEFLAAFHLERKGKNALGKLHQFHDALFMCSRRTGSTGLRSVQWVTSTALTLLGTLLSVCSSWQEQCSLLRCCIQADLHKISGAPDFVMLVNLLEHAEGEDVGVTLHDLFIAEKPLELLRKAVHFLNHKRCFVLATAVARCCSFNLGDVVLEQMKLKFEDCVHNSEDNVKQIQWNDFLKECNTCFQYAEVDAQDAFKFFKERAGMVNSYCDKYRFMQHASDWLDKTGCPSEECDSYRLHVWLLRIKAEKERPSEIITPWEVDNDALLFLASATQSPVITLTDAEELKALQKIINELLHHEQFRQATFIVSAFGHATLDYHILTTCIQLAQGSMQPSDIDPHLVEHAELFKIRTPIRRQSTIVNPAELKRPQVKNTATDALELIMQLCDASGHAFSLCNRVLVTLRVAIALSRSYYEVAGKMDTLLLLDHLLKCPDHMTLAKDVITVYNIPQADVIKLLFDKTVAAIGLCGSSSSRQKEFLDGFENLLQLCQDPAELGDLLLKARKTDLRALDGDHKGLSIEVELCIRAHDCFSASCCMEGISRTLHRCRKLTPCLVANHEFSLLVRLLTGIRRYSEMSYVFDVLHDHDRFELLFQRGMEKVPYLRVALLDYFKHRSSASSDSYTMLTLNFNMHREIAEILESSAIKKIKAIGNDDGLTWSKQELITLENALQDLADASESYIKAECILRAQSCARKAQLVALQLRYFTRKMALINLDPSQALALLINHPRFFEAQLLSEAYCLQQSWWSGAVFNRVIEAGDWEYMKDMTSAGCELSSMHLEEIAHRYNKQETGAIQREAMKRLLEAVPCVKTRFDLSQRLGFLDTAQEALATQPYLRDMCFHTGIV